MIRSLNEWREHKLKLAKKANETYLYPDNLEKQQLVQKITDAAIELKLDKDSTIEVIRNIFTDPSQSPEEINIQFVKDNLDEIIDNVRSTPDEQFATPIGYTEQMLSNESEFEQVALCENAKDLEKIDGIIVEGNIVYIPNTTKLNPTHNKRVIEFLQKNLAVNLANHIKWTRKILKTK